MRVWCIYVVFISDKITGWMVGRSLTLFLVFYESIDCQCGSPGFTAGNLYSEKIMSWMKFYPALNQACFDGSPILCFFTFQQLPFSNCI